MSGPRGPGVGSGRTLVVPAHVPARDRCGRSARRRSRGGWKSNQTTTLGPCNVHYTDNATAMGSVQVEGGLEARDGYYQVHVDIPAVDGSNDTVRDDSGCNGPINRQTTPWMAASITAGGRGDLTNPRTISGSWSAPRTGGEDTVTWSFTLPE